MKHTMEQIAYQFDCELYRLLLRAERFAEGKNLTAARWRNAARCIRESRSYVRDMMDKKPREETIG